MDYVVRVVVASTNQASRALIQQAVAEHQAGQVVAEVATDAELLDAVKYRRPQLVFISTDLSEMRGFSVADRLSRQFPGLYIAMLSPRPGNVEDLRQAMKTGARECLYEPPAEADILRILDEAKEIGKATTGQRGAVIAVMSSKGGVGKSTIAANLAIAVRQLQPSRRIALVDGDLFFGDIATLLNLKPERTIYDLSHALDEEIADQFLYRHVSGIEVLAAPLRTEQAEEITHEQFRAILQVVRTLYDVVIVDASVSAFDTMLATLDLADLAILLTTLDVICLKDVGQMVDVLEKLRFPAHNIILIGNRFDERVSVSAKDAERAVGMTFAGMLPRDDRVVMAANQGAAIITAEPGALFSQRIRGLAKMVTDRTGGGHHVPA